MIRELAERTSSGTKSDCFGGRERVSYGSRCGHLTPTRRTRSQCFRSERSMPSITPSPMRAREASDLPPSRSSAPEHGQAPEGEP